MLRSCALAPLLGSSLLLLLGLHTLHDPIHNISCHENDGYRGIMKNLKQDIKITNEETLDAYELTAYKAKSVTDNDPSVKKRFDLFIQSHN